MQNKKSCEPFDPFNVGPSNTGRRLDTKMPSYTNYPPSVYNAATMPLAKQRSRTRSTCNSVKAAKSQIGEVAISRAINEEMAVTKQQAAAATAAAAAAASATAVSSDKQRIGAGGVSQTTMPAAEAMPSQVKVNQASHTSIKTLLAANRPSGSRDASKTSVRAPSQASLHTEATLKGSQTKSVGKPLEQNADEGASERSIRSNKSNITLKSKRSSITVKAKASSSRTNSQHSSKPDIKDAYVKVKRELSLAASPAGKAALDVTLEEQASKLSARLKAGNEHRFRRFDAHTQSYFTREPLKRFRSDRMSFWYKDALLS